MRRHRSDRLTREPDGTARLRLRFTREQADRIEHQAEEDGKPLMDWIFHMLLGDE